MGIQLQEVPVGDVLKIAEGFVNSLGSDAKSGAAVRAALVYLLVAEQWGYPGSEKYVFKAVEEITVFAAETIISLRRAEQEEVTARVKATKEAQDGQGTEEPRKQAPAPPYES